MVWGVVIIYLTRWFTSTAIAALRPWEVSSLPRTLTTHQHEYHHNRQTSCQRVRCIEDTHGRKWRKTTVWPYQQHQTNQHCDETASHKALSYYHICVCVIYKHWELIFSTRQKAKSVSNVRIYDTKEGIEFPVLWRNWNGSSCSRWFTQVLGCLL